MSILCLSYDTCRCLYSNWFYVLSWSCKEPHLQQIVEKCHHHTGNNAPHWVVGANMRVSTLICLNSVSFHVKSMRIKKSSTDKWVMTPSLMSKSFYYAFWGSDMEIFCILGPLILRNIFKHHKIDEHFGQSLANFLNLYRLRIFLIEY
jgi:hypothetical protein